MTCRSPAGYEVFSLPPRQNWIWDRHSLIFANTGGKGVGT
jgi:hypothetical protein